MLADSLVGEGRTREGAEMETTARRCGRPDRRDSAPTPRGHAPTQDMAERLRLTQVLLRAAQVARENWRPSRSPSAERGSLRAQLRRASGTRAGYYNAVLFESATAALCRHLDLRGTPELDDWEHMPGRSAQDVVDALLGTATEVFRAVSA